MEVVGVAPDDVVHQTPHETRLYAHALPIGCGCGVSLSNLVHLGGDRAAQGRARHAGAVRVGKDEALVIQAPAVAAPIAHPACHAGDFGDAARAAAPGRVEADEARVGWASSADAPALEELSGQTAQ